MRRAISQDDVANTAMYLLGPLSSGVTGEEDLCLTPGLTSSGFSRSSVTVIFVSVIFVSVRFVSVSKSPYVRI